MLSAELSAGLGKTPKDPRHRIVRLLPPCPFDGSWCSQGCCTPLLPHQLQGIAVSPCSMVGDLSAYWLRLLLRLLESQPQVASDLTSQASEYPTSSCLLACVLCYLNDLYFALSQMLGLGCGSVGGVLTYHE